MPTPDLKLAYETLSGKQSHHQQRWNYYEGNQPLKWSVDRLSKVFNRDVKTKQGWFVQNWCAVIVDSVLDRLSLERLTVAEEDGLTDDLDTVFKESGLDIDAGDIHKDVVLTGEGYIIAWRDEETGEIEAYHNDSRQVHMFYDEANPRLARLAAKWWDDSKGHTHITLYYPERLEYWKRNKPTSKIDSAEFKPADWDSERTSADNPFKEIPVFEFCVDKRGASELDNVMSLQDTVNKTLSDMMVAAEFQSVPQRWLISQADYSIDGTEGQPAKIPYSPFGTVLLPGGDGEGQDTTTGTYQSADLRMFLDVLEKMARSMAIITRTPKHYLMAQAGDPSGEALMAMEAPLTRKVEKYQKRLRVAWRRVAVFLLKLKGKDVRVNDVIPLWQDVRTVQPLTQAQARQTNVAAGIPIHNQLRDEGWTEKELDQLDVDGQRAGAGAVQETTRGTPAEQAALAGVRAEEVAVNLEAAAEEVLTLASDAILTALNKTGVIDKAVKRNVTNEG